MLSYSERGEKIRLLVKELVFEFMSSSPSCQPNMDGLKQAEIFRECGLDWGGYPKATSSNQQYWVAAAIQELKSEGKVERVFDSGPWRLVVKGD
ncbi:hypothetical protein AB0533_003739 [Vibrio parahaemolyticus]|uniref:hypothetical protein n=1 Tax=Vibrio parahaemolyticus TaxID=670 RepID=UPI001E63C278|nr:hypothetical protein [Vibrio parahaemolyticus]ELB2043651.1 hypothetical protein [Vibrio parahaemolyticus]MDG2593929.1 hypothetical protein [Vibrio parahaemolyticus]